MIGYIFCKSASRKIVTLCILLFSHLIFFAAHSLADRWSIQSQAFAPNAGGQLAFALRKGNDIYEWSLFANDYLQAGSFPLVGISFTRRIEIISNPWSPIRPTFHYGMGLTSAGALAEVAWELVALYLVRVDIRSQILVSHRRVMTWSYPLWFGISVPL